MQLVNHALGGEMFLDELPAAPTQALAQRGVARQLEQTLLQSRQIARRQ